MPRVSVLRVPVSDAAKNITIRLEVTGIPVFRARLWVASQIFRFGALIAGTNIEISTRKDT